MTQRRPGVVVYITRGEDVLVFDVVNDPEYTAVIPGGGIGPGETVEEAAVREAREETGLEVTVVRNIGVVEGPRLVHYVQAAPAESTPDQWEHRNPPGPGIESEALVRCRWLRLEPGLEVWGDRGELLHTLGS